MSFYKVKMTRTKTNTKLAFCNHASALIIAYPFMTKIEIEGYYSGAYYVEIILF